MDLDAFFDLFFFICDRCFLGDRKRISVELDRVFKVACIPVEQAELCQRIRFSQEILIFPGKGQRLFEQRDGFLVFPLDPESLSLTEILGEILFLRRTQS